MRLRYGAYVTDDDEVTVLITRRVNETEAGIPYSETHTWVIDGQVHADTLAAVVVRCNLLERAFRAHKLDLVLFDPTTNVICHSLPNAGSLSGVRIVQPVHYPVGQGAELSTYRTYRVAAECEYPVPNAPLLLVKAWNETVSFSGGGPRRVLLDVVNGPAQLQTLYKQTGWRAVQTGQAVGYRGYPPVPPPLWSSDLLLEPPQVTRGSAKLKNGIFQDYPVSWTYSFGSPAELKGAPTQYPAAG